MLPFVFAEYDDPDVTILELLELVGFTVPKLTPEPLSKSTQATIKTRNNSTQTDTKYTEACTQTERPGMLWSYFV